MELHDAKPHGELVALEDDDDDDGLSVAASVSSADTAELTARIAAKTAAPQNNKSVIPHSYNVPKHHDDHIDGDSPLDDISNTCDGDDWSNHHDDVGKEKDDDSVDTATLERRIWERRQGPKPNDQLLEDEFVLPDDDCSSCSSSSSSSQDEEQRAPLSTRQPQEERTTPPSTQQVPLKNDVISSEVIPPNASIRLGLHRPPPSACQVRKPASTALADDVIEDSSSDDEIGGASMRNRRRKSLSLVTSQKKKGPLTQQTLRFSASVKKRPPRRQPKDPVFSPPRPPSPYVEAHTNANNSGGTSNRPQDTDSHDFSIVASAYEDAPRYQPMQQASEERSFHGSPNRAFRTGSREHTPLEQERIYNTFRRPDPTARISNTGQFGHQDACHFQAQTMNRHAAAVALPPQQIHAQTLTHSTPMAIPRLEQPIAQDRQPDFSITASAYEAIPYRPFVPPPAAAARGGGGRRIRDAAARPRRKQGKRKKGRPAARGRQPTKSRKQAARSRSAPVESQRAFQRAPDEHLSGVGGASMRF